MKTASSKKPLAAISLAVLSLLASVYVCWFASWWLAEKPTAVEMMGRHCKWVTLMNERNTTHDVRLAMWTPAMWFVKSVLGYEPFVENGRGAISFVKEIQGHEEYDKPEVAIRKFWIVAGMIELVVLGLCFRLARYRRGNLPGASEGQSPADKPA